MYKIIGADQKAYGPVSAEQIRQWIAESRVNGQTQVQLEGTDEWKPLSAFPEFADLLGANAPIPPSVAPAPSPLSREAALQAVKGPAIGLKVTAILGLIAVAFRLVINIVSLLGVQVFGPTYTGNSRFDMVWTRTSGGLGILEAIIGAVLGIVILNGAAKMQALQNYQFVFIVCILAMLPLWCCCILGLPFGIWALVVLNRPEVKSQFS